MTLLESMTSSCRDVTVLYLAYEQYDTFLITLIPSLPRKSVIVTCSVPSGGCGEPVSATLGLSADATRGPRQGG